MVLLVTFSLGKLVEKHRSVKRKINGLVLVLYIRIQLGSVFSSFMDPDSKDPNWGKFKNPDPNTR